MEPDIAKAFLDSLRKAISQYDLDVVQRLIEQGDIEGAINSAMGGVTTSSTIYAPMLAVTGLAAKTAMMSFAPQAGATVGLTASQPIEITAMFGVPNPKALSFVQQYPLRLIREVDDATRAGIRQHLLDGLKAGENPRTVATSVKGVIGLTKTQEKAVSNFRKEIETIHLKSDPKAGGMNLGGSISRAPGGAQTYEVDGNGNPVDGITQRRLRDYRYDRTLARAITDGKPLEPEQVDKMVEAYRQKYLKYRAETIARTESLRALNIGSHAAYMAIAETSPELAGMLKRQWVLARDERTCKRCKGVVRLNPGGVGLDEPFRTTTGTIMHPPEHPSCRCVVTVSSLSGGDE